MRGLKSSGIIPDDAAFRAVDAWIYAFHMPLFFLISGLFIDRQAARPARVFLLDKVGSIVYPYAVWSVLQSAVQIALARYTNAKPEWGAVARIGYQPIMQFWFCTSYS